LGGRRQRHVEQGGQTLQRFERLDALVHCAGRSARGDVLQTSADDFQALWELNFLAAVRCTLAAVEHLRATGGHLVHIGSLASKTAPRYMAAYPATKFALAAYAQQLRLALAPQGVHTLLVCPGPIARHPDQPPAEPKVTGANLPPEARGPGGGAQVPAIDPSLLSDQILTACRRRQAELVLPSRSRLLFALSQLWPAAGDRLLQKVMRQQ